jgi:outer membrane protein assembly factor BamB
MRNAASLLLCAGLFSGLLARAGEEWSRFRGPDGSGLAEAPDLPVKWSATDFDWQVKLPGAGHSSPVARGDKLFLFCGERASGKRTVVCLRLADGGECWRKELPSPTHDMHKLNSYGSATPAVDAERVYVTWSSPKQVTLLAFDHAGEVVWKRDDLGTFEAQHGSGASPIVWEDLVILPNDTEGEDSFLIAVNAKTGATVWKHPRKTTKASYATPCLLQVNGEAPQLLFADMAHGLSALDPRKGTLLWEVKNIFSQRVVSSPVVSGGLIFCSCGVGGRGTAAVAVKPGTRAKPAEAKLAYKRTKSVPYVPSAVGYGDLVFLCSDAGVLQCLHAATGKQVWRERLGARFFASPVCVNGKLYLATVKGEMLVLAAADKYELLARNPLGEGTYATPAVVGGRLIVRTFTHLISIGGKSTR